MDRTQVVLRLKVRRKRSTIRDSSRGDEIRVRSIQRHRRCTTKVDLRGDWKNDNPRKWEQIQAGTRPGVR